MATITASPPAMSPPMAASSSQPSLPPLITSNPRRRPSSQRPTSWVSQRMSSYSSQSKASHQQNSRPASYVFPAFHSSLPYTLVRDFAYPSTHPSHYGPPPTQSGLTTPGSDARRLSDPVVASWEDSRSYWSATPPWMGETSQSFGSRDQLPAMAFNDGPPYSEDEDLHSPVVTSSRHRKQRSGEDRGRSPGAAGPDRGVVVTAEGRYTEDGEPGLADGPGGVIENYPSNIPRQPEHRDSNFAKPLQRDRLLPAGQDQILEDDDSDIGGDGRFSRDYSFTIADPDEEMHGKAVALFDFESEHQNELPLREGQIILVSYRHGQGWLVAEDPRTGESGLVPEEFVRLVRDIEGGLNGLNSVSIDEENGDTTESPTFNETDTPTPMAAEFPSNVSKSNQTSDKHKPIQSSFSTSSKDLDPYPLPTKREDSTTPSSKETRS